MRRDHNRDYSPLETDRCHRTLVTLIGDIGPWQERVVLVGGLAPLYIVGSLPRGAPLHAGTTDVDLVVRLVVDDTSGAYETLYRNLRSSGLVSTDPSYRWLRAVDGQDVRVEFLCDTDQVEAGRIHRPGKGTGSGFSACNIPGALLATRDFIEAEAEGERVDGGGRSTVPVRVAGLLPYVVLKVTAFQARHGNKDAYDLIYTLLNFPEGPDAAGQVAAASPVRDERQVIDALDLLRDRFLTPSHDGPSAYADFLAEEPHDVEVEQRLRYTAVEAVARFLVAAGAQ